jgi:hypothetical protein
VGRDGIAPEVAIVEATCLIRLGFMARADYAEPHAG